MSYVSCSDGSDLQIHFHENANGCIDVYQLALMPFVRWAAKREVQRRAGMVRTSDLEFKEEVSQYLEKALADDTWLAKCKGRELLKAYCGELNIKYELFRNLLIDLLEVDPISRTPYCSCRRSPK
ncbi:hypothetical protein [Sulfuriferula multivorans]|uniref:hypothetical protein n=1 Tax=Sulfuriferula multivorans TaxID=1559896 RepID=UPI000F5BD391|nr:hypothetical protein [Sulfuriferula multivorans]